MTKNARRRYRAVLYFLDIRRTHAANRYFDQQFVFSNGRHRHGFDAQVVWPAVNHRAHGSRNVQHPAFLNTDETDEHTFLYEREGEVDSCRLQAKAVLRQNSLNHFSGSALNTTS